MELKIEMNSLKDAVNRVVKKQKLSCSKTQEVINKFVREIEKAIGMMQSTTDDYKSVLTELKTKLHEIDPLITLVALEHMGQFIMANGKVLLGRDSHTCTVGAFGHFAIGIGHTDAGFVLGTGKLMLKAC
ncbi:hypothetical protein F3Y22_tig00110057pilonHSYRG00232 [Hibiscus syriacus]|uniref:Aconitase/3-isopropylmalate dehydratase large subunit alpha/beta/alpha domain-containing protein n=1 Tax=Hibiscus syriacus TaxID=106335 RepID=A0A6A3BJP8_HIBSY|nr:hypothetical protein F3Y22_tig00110057pilonHSYRG00232 [Hibiscus syriacus]